MLYCHKPNEEGDYCSKLVFKSKTWKWYAENPNFGLGHGRSPKDLIYRTTAY